MENNRTDAMTAPPAGTQAMPAVVAIEPDRYQQ
jgi:hypothetical protein